MPAKAGIQEFFQYAMKGSGIVMSSVYPICEAEHRDLDGFDLIYILGLMKEYNWQEIWRRYLPEGQGDTISMYVANQSYFLEMHVQKMQRIILSEKFNTNPFFMQQVIQRITAFHDHDLILEKIRQQGIDTSENPISLACSMGNIIIDFIANRNDPFPTPEPRPHGDTHVEITEKRPIDVYDLSSTLYLCQQNLTDSIFRRYGSNGRSGEQNAEVTLSTVVGDYKVNLSFRLIFDNGAAPLSGSANVSVYTMHQVLQRMNFKHALELIDHELKNVGVTVPENELNGKFSLCRFINNTALKLDFEKIQ
jgi:hypothetical protein